jgi:predicted ATPase/DNA-binding CsgD family transcriptional regulator
MAPSNLPVQLTSFIGRQRELADVERLLATSRLVTLTGAGGCGKTRLALQVANTVSGRFADGLWLADLSSLRDPELVPQLIGQAVGLRSESNQPLLELLIDFLRPKQLLLILDNCEHLIAACVELAQPLLSQAPNLQILAASRTPLALPGETLYPVHGLVWPDGEGRLDHPGNQEVQEFMAYDAVRLFVERAQAIAPHFDLTTDNTAAIVELCRKLDGLPLAIELASARVNVLTVQQIVARLADRFNLLIARPRTGLESRHQTLRAAVDWSYALLTVEEQTLLRRLAVFQAGCTLDTAEGVCSGEGLAEGHTLDLLSSLVDKSFVIAETTGRVEARYRLLETIREYALEKLEEAGETAQLRDHHLGLFLRRTEEIATKLLGPDQQLWLDWLEGEHDNIRAALTWAVARQRIEDGLRITNSLYQFWEVRGYRQEGLVWFERLLAQTDGDISLAVHVDALTYATFLSNFLGKTAAAVAYGRQAVALGETAGEAGKPILAFALAAMATAMEAVGDYQNVFSITGQAIQLYRELGEPYRYYLGMSVLVQGQQALIVGKYGVAHAMLEEALVLAREAGDTYRVAIALDYVGDLARCEEKYAKAQTSYEDSIALLKEIGATRDLAALLHNLGHTYLHLGNIERAHSLFLESMAAHQSQQNVPGVVECLIGFAAIAVVRSLPGLGVRLLSAMAGLGWERGAAKWPVTRREYEQTLALARIELTDAEFQTEQTAGRALSLEQAVKVALSLPAAPTGQTRPEGGLTDREHEVTALIAQGKSNSEIAAELVLSKRTIEKHVGNILAKLGFKRREQIVRWAIKNQLT